MEPRPAAPSGRLDALRGLSHALGAGRTLHLPQPADDGRHAEHACNRRRAATCSTAEQQEEARRAHGGGERKPAPVRQPHHEARHRGKGTGHQGLAPAVAVPGSQCLPAAHFMSEAGLIPQRIARGHLQECCARRRRPTAAIPARRACQGLPGSRSTQPQRSRHVDKETAARRRRSARHRSRTAGSARPSPRSPA